MEEMCRNLDIGFPTLLPPPSDGTLGPGFQIMVDEIKVEGRMRWDQRSNMILGLCREHGANFELLFLDMAQAEAIHAGLLANKIHLASQVRCPYHYHATTEFRLNFLLLRRPWRL
jgi:hypothetical protein